MRILHVLTTINPAAGGPVEAARLYSSHPGDSYRAEILTFDDDISQWSDHWPVPAHAAGHSRVYRRYCPRAVAWLETNAARFDAVVVHGVWGYHLVAVWRALRNSETPYFVILHGMLNPWFRRTYPLKHWKKALAWRALVGRTLRDSAGILYLCAEERRLALSTFAIPCSSAAFAGLGAPASDVAPGLFLRRFPDLRSRRILLFLGRICYMKGCDLLLRAFAEASETDPRAHLVLSGPDQENCRSQLERSAEALGIQERITWTGPLYGDEKRSAMAAAELFLLPSRCETFPVAVIEALAAGTPVLITREVNVYPEIEAEGAGLVCRADAGSISDAITAWLKRDVETRQLARSRARACHARHFTLEKAFGEHQGAIRALLAERKTNWAARYRGFRSHPENLRTN